MQAIRRYRRFPPFSFHLCTPTRILRLHLSSSSNGSQHKNYHSLTELHTPNITEKFSFLITLEVFPCWPLVFLNWINLSYKSHCHYHSTLLILSWTQTLQDRQSVGQSAPKQSIHLRPTTRFPKLSDSRGPADAGCPSPTTRGQVRNPQPLPALTRAINLGSESRWTRVHTPSSRIRDFPFVATHDSQAHGGGIPPRLHMGLVISIIFPSYRSCLWHYYLCIIFHV
jgi:hypothetical protein